MTEIQSTNTNMTEIQPTNTCLTFLDDWGKTTGKNW